VHCGLGSGEIWSLPFARTPSWSSEGRFAVLDDLSFEIGIGEVVAIRGPNGSGKSTLLATIGDCRVRGAK
jgi:ABC-type lipoprotein export system ATPase subunit